EVLDPARGGGWEIGVDRSTRGRPRLWHRRYPKSPRSIWTAHARLLRAWVVVWSIGLLAALGGRYAGAAEADCHELDRNYTSAKADLTSIQLNAMLFVSAAKDCGALARRLIAAGASLQARDRTGSMPLAHAARGGHAALVERVL